MPTYEYVCGNCHHTFEEFQSIKAAPITICPKCKKKKVKRLISGGAGFLFKGSGFYITDYRSDTYKSAAKNDSPKTDPAKTETKSESPPPTTSAAAPSSPSTPAKKAK
ncbi:MAG: hypothetical protein FWD61_10745 [Phycisphaerales bacterium]|nr:hypothetical protein [Phycisphaerales bacterium]